MKRVYRIVAAIFIGLFISAGFYFFSPAESSPLLANYYLGELRPDSSLISALARYDLLILVPTQMAVHPEVVRSIRALNSDIIILAYVPSQSYNFQYWDNDAVFKYLRPIRDEWWLKDSRGSVISAWPGIYNLNMAPEWSQHLVDFINQHVLTLSGVDGIFFDMVSENISWLNGGELDMNGDGVRDESAAADALWLERTRYLLQLAQQSLKTKYLIINGTSQSDFQSYINGRMYENYPTTWGKDRFWSGVMSGLKKNRTLNSAPQMYVFNANTNNTGQSKDYKRVRFSLASSLLVDDVYFSFDYGTESHGQTWWYDEYDVGLGEPAGEARGLNGEAQFVNSVWRRDYSHGVALVNATTESQEVELGADYEKIKGQQDPAVNTGEVVDKVRLGAKDGLVMLKSLQSLSEATFINGSLVRFFDLNGGRVRNGFFAFDQNQRGGARVFHGNLDGSAGEEMAVANGRRLTIYNQQGNIWYDDYPLGANGGGRLNIALGRLVKGGPLVLASGATAGGELSLQTYYGALIKDNVYPFGRRYNRGLSVAIGAGAVVVGSGSGRVSEIMAFDSTLQVITARFYPFGNKTSQPVVVATGDFDGDGSLEIAAAVKNKNEAQVRVFKSNGKNISKFIVPLTFGGQELLLSAADVNFDGQDEIVVSN